MRRNLLRVLKADPGMRAELDEKADYLQFAIEQF
jgi:hypothetical protein